MNVSVLSFTLLFATPALAGAQALETPLYALQTPGSETLELLWNAEGLARRATAPQAPGPGPVETVLPLDCRATLDADQKLVRFTSYTGGPRYRCAVESRIVNDAPPMRLERECRLTDNGRFFELICEEAYDGGAHPDNGRFYRYVTHDGQVLAEAEQTRLLERLPLEAGDKSRRLDKAVDECARELSMPKNEAREFIGEPTPTRLGIDAEGRALVGLVLYLPRVARGVSCDQKTVWVRASDPRALDTVLLRPSAVRRLAP